MKNLFTGLTVGMGWVTVLVLVFFLLALLPLFEVLLENGSKLFYAFTAALFIMSLSAGSVTSGFSELNRKPNSVSYLYNADTSEAIWFTCDREADEWTSQFFSRAAERRETGEIFPLMKRCVFTNSPFLIDRAPPIRAEAPRIRVRGDTAGQSRILSLEVIPGPGSSAALIFIRNDNTIKEVYMGDDRLETFPVAGLKAAHRLLLGRIDNEGFISIMYNAPPESGIPLKIISGKNSSVELTCIDVTYGTPGIEGFRTVPRGKDMMPSPGFFVKDSTMVSKKIRL